jgi:septum formation protein
MRRRVVLASASSARLATLRSAGLSPEVVVSGVDESQVDADTAADLVLTLATAKAEAVAARCPDALVIGCDSVLALDGLHGGDAGAVTVSGTTVHGKPADPEQARQRWRAMRGGSGVLHTGHAVLDTRHRTRVCRAAATVVHFADVGDHEIDEYVATGEPLRVAGAFTLDGLGGAFVTGIEGDPHNVVGISLPLLREMLAELGTCWTDLWRVTPLAPGP